MAWDGALVASCFAAFAGFLAHIADVLTCYSSRSELEQLFQTPGDILDFQKASVMMAEKTIWELAAGHIMALIFIPSGFAGAYLLYHALKPQYNWLRWPLVVLLFAFYVAGALMHCSFTFVGLLASAPARGYAVPAGLQTSFQPFFEAGLWQNPEAGRLMNSACLKVHRPKQNNNFHLGQMMGPLLGTCLIYRALSYET